MKLSEWQLKASKMPRWPTVDRDDLVDLINYTDLLEATLRKLRDKPGCSIAVQALINTVLRER